MSIKNLFNNVFGFTLRRLIEIFGLIIFGFGLLLFIALITYSPDDPNFIFPSDNEIKNFLGFNGSLVSDFFFQSIGLVAYLVPFTLIFTGINIVRIKDFFLLIQNIFFMILYLIIGSLFLSFFYINSFVLYINGNGGFIGNYLN